jgi:hypothetical protein
VAVIEEQISLSLYGKHHTYSIYTTGGDSQSCNHHHALV